MAHPDQYSASSACYYHYSVGSACYSLNVKGWEVAHDVRPRTFGLLVLACVLGSLLAVTTAPTPAGSIPPRCSVTTTTVRPRKCPPTTTTAPPTAGPTSTTTTTTLPLTRRFPIAVWYESVSSPSDLATDQALGINTYVRLGGSNLSLLPSGTA